MCVVVVGNQGSKKGIFFLLRKSELRLVALCVWRLIFSLPGAREAIHDLYFFIFHTTIGVTNILGHTSFCYQFPFVTHTHTRREVQCFFFSRF